MSLSTKIVAFVCAAGLLAGCAEAVAPLNKTLSKGSQIGVRAMIAAHEGETACTDYDAGSKSCASSIKSKISGNTLTSIETALVRGAKGVPKRVELVTRGKVSDGRTCIDASGISLGKGSQGSEGAEFLLAFTKEAVASRGGICATYYTAGENFVVRTTWADGTVFPPGDTALRFFQGPVTLRVQ